ncbi:hypothetical protein Pflav_022110 [Phytohabitans flavus]|uniref:GH15-like domain-containing protein n=1 Tax=Phytohabitans flavus TaxID=1076124 RepID=A0A6F8XPY0_9ACTN|nr:hypothetical protein Pflav_022110 [Phytohabitans flavus]
MRFGNGAADQHQLDGYGWVIDAAWVLVQAGRRLYGETWRTMRAFADLVAQRWSEPDAGIWEIRGGPAQLVHSKLMAWLALDRALQIADTHRVRPAQRTRWTVARDAIAAEVRERGFDPAKASYTRDYGSTELDAALLLLPVIGLDDPDSPRVHGTIAAIRDELSAGGPLLFRYPPGRDGLPGPRAPSCRAPSGWYRPSPAPDGWTRRWRCSRSCSTAPAHSASTPRRWTRPRACTSATTRRPSPTPPSSRPP